MAESNRENKDRLFCYIFGPENKAWTLSLYNAVNGSSYQDPNDITITTVKSALYMSMKNDLSFLIGETMNFYEQQSSYNPNMPVRFLVYAGMVYSSYIDNKSNQINIYSSRQQNLPVPKLICFYNGVQTKEDEVQLNLSSAFPEGSDPDIAVKVRMLNINFGRNMELLNACRPLWEYSWLIDKILKYKEETGSIENAVDRAVEELPEKSVIKDFLVTNKAEVKRMCITEYDEAWTMEMFKEEGRAEGRAEGRDETLKLSIQKLMKTMKMTAQQAMDALEISRDDQQRYLGML